MVITMKVLISLLFITLTACSSLPTSIRTEPVPELKFEQAQTAIELYIGQRIRWGGQIVKVSNQENQSILEIVQFPLNSYGRPMIDKTSQGRFIAHSKDFFDPFIYRQGTAITISGTIESERTMIIDKKSLSMPVIDITEIHRWRPRNYNNHTVTPYLYQHHFYPPYSIHRYRPYWY